LQAYFTPAKVKATDLTGRVAVVIDVLRATSTMIEALANGARTIFPVATIDEAVRLGQNLDRTATLLCGERKSVRIEGFDLGNSPFEFTDDAVAGKALVMSTTNGTRAVLCAADARRALVASLLNLDAVAQAVAEDGDDVAIICAGREQRFALEDAVCAGLIAERVRRLVAQPVRPH